MLAFCQNITWIKTNAFSPKIIIAGKNYNRPCHSFGGGKKLSSKEKNESESQENSILAFFQEVKDEIKMVEWPTIDRLSKQFVIVVISLVFSSILIFSVDGLFATMSKYLFEGKQ